MIADENTPLGLHTSSRRAGTRALPDLHSASPLGIRTPGQERSALAHQSPLTFDSPHWASGSGAKEPHQVSSRKQQSNPARTEPSSRQTAKSNCGFDR